MKWAENQVYMKQANIIALVLIFMAVLVMTSLGMQPLLAITLIILLAPLVYLTRRGVLGVIRFIMLFQRSVIR